MPYFFFYLAIGLGVLDWIAVARGWRRVSFAAKPGVIAALILFCVVNGGLQDTGAPGTALIWFIGGLLASMLGDILLMLPREQFTGGLLAFLAAHVLYILGFNPLMPLVKHSVWVAALLVGLAVLAEAPFLQRIFSALARSGQNRLRLPLLAYNLALVLMLVSALFTLLNERWAAPNALAAALGACLFFLSDSLLAWNRFVAPLSNGHLKVRITYHLAQYLITLGAALHFLKN
ncbi:MAG: lysoplasmalogenase [Chloroflexota bacterium]